MSSNASALNPNAAIAALMASENQQLGGQAYVAVGNAGPYYVQGGVARALPTAQVAQIEDQRRRVKTRSEYEIEECCSACSVQ